MSWLYLPEQVEACLPQSGCLGGEQFVTSKMQSTPSKSCKPESEMDCSTMHPFGTTLEHSTGDLGVDAWILSLQGSRVSHSVQSETNLPEMTTKISGLTQFASLDKSDPNGVFWKTYLGFFFREADISVQFSGTWPKAGTMHLGVCYRQPKWERRIKEIDCSLWPTPLAANPGSRLSQGNARTLQQAVQIAEGIRHKDGTRRANPPGGTLNPAWVEWLMGWPPGWTDLRPLEMGKYPLP